MDRRDLRDLCRARCRSYQTDDGLDTIGLAEDVARDAVDAGWSYRDAVAYAEDYAQQLDDDMRDDIPDGKLSLEGREQHGGLA